MTAEGWPDDYEEPTQNFTTEGQGFSFSIFAPPPQAVPSVYRSQEGIGYPSCSRALARIPPNINDANDYYKTIGVDPWADEKTIKSAIRKHMANYHPDRDDSDATEEEKVARRSFFERLKEIATVLLNPILRANYNSIPQGRKLIDSAVLKDMEDRGIGEDDPGVQKFARMPEDMDGKETDAKGKRKKAKMWDYLATDHNEMDLVNANEWYGYLLDIAPMFQYDGVIKVLLHDGRVSAFKKQGSIMLIPREWEPNAGSALLMFAEHVGWPKLAPRYAEQPFSVRNTSYAGWTGTGLNGGGGLLLSPNVSIATQMSADPGSF